MTLSHAIAAEPVPPMVSNWTAGWGNISEGIASSNPGSGTANTNTAFYVPVYVPTTTVVRRMWWVNGGTVSPVYLLEAGVYADASGKPGRMLATTGPISQGTASQIQFADLSLPYYRSLTFNGSAADGDTYSTSSAALGARPNTVYGIALVNTHATNAPVPASVATSTTSFTSRGSVQYSSGTKRISLWTAVPTSDDTDSIEISFGASSGTTGCGWYVFELRNVDTATNHGVVQTNSNTGSDAAPGVTLSAFASSRNPTIAVVGHSTNSASVAADAGWDEMNERVFSPPDTGVAALFNAVADTSPTATLSSSQAWGMLGFEFQGANVGAPIVLTPNLYWLYLSSSSSSATLFRSFMASNTWDDILQMQQTVAPGNAPAVATPAEGSANNTYLFGFSTEPMPTAPTVSGTTVTAASATFTPSGSWSDGDLMVVVATSDSTTPSLPAGWTNISTVSTTWDDGGTGGTVYSRTAYKVKSGTGSDTFTNAAAVRGIAIAGAGVVGSITSNGAVLSLTETAGWFNDLVVYICLHSGLSTTPPSGHTEHIDTTTHWCVEVASRMSDPQSSTYTAVAAGEPEGWLTYPALSVAFTIRGT